MNEPHRIDELLLAALQAAEGPGHPPRLAAAVRHAVLPGGARVRPRLVLAVAAACGNDEPALAGAAAVAIELLHCASLVHDDLPCFDDAPLRRGLPSVHRAFGERLAVLAGDALIVRAFQVLAEVRCSRLTRVPPVLATVAAGVGMPGGICAGQAWECEPQVSLAQYQRAKTGALFGAATAAGAQAAGAEPAAWRAFGECLGEAYQVADDVRDVAADPGLLGKPIGRDLALGRPSVARRDGVAGAIGRFRQLISAASQAVPECPGAEQLRTLVRLESERLVPSALCAEWMASAA